MVLDPEDSVIVEEFTYPSALESMHPLQVNTVGIKMDREGMLDTDLEDVLSHWEFSSRGRGKRPHVMYTVTYRRLSVAHSNMKGWAKPDWRNTESRTSKKDLCHLSKI